jgi:cell division control protein 7
LLIGTSQNLPFFLKQVPQFSSTFNLIKCIGRGSYGIVMLGEMKSVPDVKFALKYLLPTACVKAPSEIKALQMIGKHANIIELLTVARHEDQVVLVFPYFEHDNFTCLLKTMNLVDVKFYMHSLLSGLAYIHSKGIIHRDVKPSNYLYNKEVRLGKLIDFGLVNNLTMCHKPHRDGAIFKKPYTTKKLYMSCDMKQTHCCHDDTSVCGICMSRRSKKVPRSGTTGYRAPEILFAYAHQTSTIDIWSAGVILLSILSKKYPFFLPQNDSHALAEIIQIFGSNICVQAAQRLGIALISSEYSSGISLDTFCILDKSTNLFKELSTLLKCTLIVDPINRITAEQALCLKLFKVDCY